MARMQRDGRTVDMQARFSFGDAVDACEGGADMLPVPVAVVSGKADIEHLKVKRFNRYLHVAYLCLIKIALDRNRKIIRALLLLFIFCLRFLRHLASIRVST